MQNKIRDLLSDMDSLFTEEIIQKISESSRLKSEAQWDAIYIKWNTEGILRLIAFLVDIAKIEQIDHFHFDQHNWMEKDSIELIFEKNDTM